MSVDFSVIIPAHNRAEQLLLTLTSFDLQTYPKDRFEVIVVDDGSTDDTKIIVEGFHTSYSLIYSSTGKVSGRSKARNMGIKLAKGSYVIFCDSDFIVTPEFLKIVNEYHNQYPNTVISGIPNSWGSVFTQYYPTLTLWHKQTMYESLNPKGLWKNEYWGDEKNILPLLTSNDLYRDFYSIEKYISIADVDEDSKSQFRQTDVAPWLLFVTRCVSVEKKYLDAVGWFDEEFVNWGLEDWELGYRLHRHGISFQCIHETIGYHQEHPRKEEQEGQSNMNNLKKIYKKYGFLDPELNLLSVHGPWTKVKTYKSKLRLIKWYEQIGKEKKANRIKNMWRRKAIHFYKGKRL